jgi:hypothetical protein
MVRLLSLLALLVPALAHADGSREEQLNDLDRRLSELKTKVFESHGRLEAMKRRYLSGDVGTRALILHRNEMGPLYSLVRMAFSLDGDEVFTRSDDAGLLPGGGEVEILHRPLAATHHTLSVKLVYRGQGGPITYVEGYRMTVQGSHTFAADDGKETRIQVVGFERGNPLTTDFADRPAVEFRTTTGRPGDGR